MARLASATAPALVGLAGADDVGRAGDDDAGVVEATVVVTTGWVQLGWVGSVVDG